MYRFLAGAASIALGLATSSEAALRSFVGEYGGNPAAPQPDPRCTSPELLVVYTPETANTAGTSNYGDFAPSLTHCVAPGNPWIGGVFSFDFDAGDSLIGTATGFATPTDVPDVFNQFVTYTVTGGTGRFLDASGVLNAVGIFDRRGAPPWANQLDVTGTLDLPAVPEPAAWGLMIAGFGLVGGALRRRPTRVVA